jgi:hypothetical protein
MRFVISGEWTRNRLLKVIVSCFLAYTFILWVSNAAMYFSKMSLLPSSVVRYYLGDAERYMEPRTAAGMLEVLHYHSFAMGILLLTLTHLLLFVPLSARTKAFGVAGAFISGIADELSGWGVRFVHAGFAYAKVFFFVSLEVVLLWLMIAVLRALVSEAPSDYESESDNGNGNAARNAR